MAPRSSSSIRTPSELDELATVVVRGTAAVELPDLLAAG